jgi:prophage endopeptidase
MIAAPSFLKACWKPIALLLIAAALFGAGYKVRDFQADRDEARAREQQAKAIAAQQAENRKKEQEYAKLNAEVDGQYLELAAAQMEVTNLRAGLAGGSNRLSVRTVPGTCRVSSHSPGAGVDNEAGRADIDSRDAVDIIGIVARGDEAIRQLNALQDRELWFSQAR